MLLLDPCGFCQHLPPAVLACRLDSEQAEPLRRKSSVPVFLDSGKHKIRSRMIFCFLSTCITDFVATDDMFDVILERVTHSRFPAILDTQREADKCIDIRCFGAESFLQPR